MMEISGADSQSHVSGQSQPNSRRNQAQNQAQMALPPGSLPPGVQHQGQGQRGTNTKQRGGNNNNMQRGGNNTPMQQNMDGSNMQMDGRMNGYPEGDMQQSDFQFNTNASDFVPTGGSAKGGRQQGQKGGQKGNQQGSQQGWNQTAYEGDNQGGKQGYQGGPQGGQQRGGHQGAYEGGSQGNHVERTPINIDMSIGGSIAGMQRMGPGMDQGSDHARSQKQNEPRDGRRNAEGSMGSQSNHGDFGGQNMRGDTMSLVNAMGPPSQMQVGYQGQVQNVQGPRGQLRQQQPQPAPPAPGPPGEHFHKHCHFIFDTFLSNMRDQDTNSFSSSWNEASGPLFRDILGDTTAQPRAMPTMMIPQGMVGAGQSNQSNRSRSDQGSDYGGPSGNFDAPKHMAQGNNAPNMQLMSMMPMPGRSGPESTSGSVGGGGMNFGGQMAPGGHMSPGGQMTPGGQMGGMPDQVSCFGFLLPLGYLSWCVWAVWNFPTKMQQGNVQFLREYAFLFFRSRSEMYGYFCGQLFRNLVISLTPLIPNIVWQLILMFLVMIAQVVVTVQLQPYRVWHANFLECLFACLMLNIIFGGAFFVPGLEAAEVTTIAWCSAAAMAVVFISAPTIMVYISIRAYQMRRNKPFEFFLCHFKAGEGSLARLMKMVLLGVGHVRQRTFDIGGTLSRTMSGGGKAQKTGQSATRAKTVFLDSDNLLNLDKLFDYVGSQSDVLVVLSSSKILTRPWCMGELVTGMNHGVNTVKVIVPGFKAPDKDFIDNYKTYVPDIVCLAERGISLEMVQKMMGWLNECPAINISGISKGTLSTLSDELLLRRIPQKEKVADMTIDHLCQKDVCPPETTTLILVDAVAMEAVSTAHVLATLLSSKFQHSPHDIPFVWDMSKNLPSTTKIVLIICTNGAFQQPGFLMALWAAAEMSVKTVPILADEGFRFPSPEFLESNRATIYAATESPATMTQLILDVFKSIAVVFQPEQYSSTEEVLRTKADQIVTRITSTGILQTLSLTDREEEMTETNSI